MAKNTDKNSDSAKFKKMLNASVNTDIEYIMQRMAKKCKDIAFIPYNDAMLFTLIFDSKSEGELFMKKVKSKPNFEFIISNISDKYSYYLKYENFQIEIHTSVKYGLYPFIKWGEDGLFFILTHGIWEDGIVGKVRAFPDTHLQLNDVFY